MQNYFFLALLTMTLTGGISAAPKIQAFNVDLTIGQGQTAVKTLVQTSVQNPVCVVSASDEFGGMLQANGQMIGNSLSVTLTSDTPPAAAITARVSVICTKRTQ